MHMSSFHSRLRTRGLIAAMWLALPVGLIPTSLPAATSMIFDIPSEPLDDALKAYGRLTGRQLLYTNATVAGRMAPPLAGRFSPDAALRHLLAGSGIAVRNAAPNVIVLSAGPVPARPADRPTPVRRQPISSASSPDDAAGTIVVTGTNIRGAADGPSPLTVIDRDSIDHSGFGTVAQMIASLPQNFGGTGNEQTSLTGADRTVDNTGLSSSANLRGLGSDATLTLINGRRVAGAGSMGDFTDLSTIPLGAVNRIEVLTDGASALYGSDAVGGVVNIILRKRLDGGETRLRAGSVTAGGQREFQASQLLGTTWSSGHILGFYEYAQRGALSADDRRQTASADLRRFGGGDQRTYYARPGTILMFDPATSAYVPGFAIPSGQDGTKLTPTDFRIGSNLQNQNAGIDLLPRQTRHSAYLTGEQELGSAITAYAEGRYSHRAFRFAGAAPVSLLTVTPANPYFVSPNGQPFSLIAYSFADQLGPSIEKGKAEAYSGTGGITAKPFGDWLVDSYASYASQRDSYRLTGLVNDTLLGEALGSRADLPQTDYNPARDGYFNPYAAAGAGNQAALASIGRGFQAENIQSRVLTFSTKADGTLFALPGGPLKLAVGGEFRREHFERTGSTFYSGVTPTVFKPVTGKRSVTSAFAELAIPIVGPDNQIPGIRRLNLSIAGRYEHYSDFGDTTNPKVGLVWEPDKGVLFRASYGTSFRAPTLRELRNRQTISPAALINAQGGRTLVLFRSGGNPNLGPERAKSLSIGTVITPVALPGFRADVGYFRTRFRDRIGAPAFQNIATVLVNPDLAPFVHTLDTVNNAADRALVQAIIDDPANGVPAGYTADLFKAIVDSRSVNTSAVTVRGIDAQLSQRFDFHGGTAVVNFSGTWLLDYKRQLTTISANTDIVDTVGNPASFRAKASADWSNRIWGITTSLQYVGSYSDAISVPNRPVSSWTTVDLQLRYAPRDATDWRRGLSVSLSIQNLFDQDPPFVNNLNGIGYDAANADIIGRFISLQLIRSF